MQFTIDSIFMAIIDGGIVLAIIAFFALCLVLIGAIIKVAGDCWNWILS